MTDETRQSPAEVSHEHLHSVVHRRGSLTKDDYREAISDLARAMVQDEVRHICCSVCEDTGHTAETCHHNPLLLARQWSQATGVYCCYHCGFVATNDEEARDHFGYNAQVKPKCLRRAPLASPQDIMQTVRDEWGSRLCYRDENGVRDCREGHCRCADIAIAIDGCFEVRRRPEQLTKSHPEDSR